METEVNEKDNEYNVFSFFGNFFGHINIGSNFNRRWNDDLEWEWMMK